MKRLILMGGRPWVSGDKGGHFTNVLFRYFPASVNLAFCIFAQPESEWDETRNWNISMFDKFSRNRKINYQTMNPENFLAISEWADVIYIPGGNPFNLHSKLTGYGDLRKIWDGKVVAGSSAGADLFYEAFTYLQDKSMGKSLGWVKATCIPHWRDNFNNYTKKDWDWAERECISKYPELPVLCIPEGQSVEFTVR